MPALIADPAVEERLVAERRAGDGDRKDEVWNEIYIIMPDPNVEHQETVGSVNISNLPTSVVARTPEPGTLALLGAGAIGLLGYSLWRRAARRTGKLVAFDQGGPQKDGPAILSMPSRRTEVARRAA